MKLEDLVCPVCICRMQRTLLSDVHLKDKLVESGRREVYFSSFTVERNSFFEYLPLRTVYLTSRASTVTDRKLLNVSV